jgi:hypothetical protein
LNRYGIIYLVLRRGNTVTSSTHERVLQEKATGKIAF